MTEQTILSVTANDVTYTITAPDDLTCTDFIRYCAHLAKAQGYEVIPNQWEASFITVTEAQGLFTVAVKAKHVSGETISVSVQNPNLANAKAMFWNRWNGEVAATGWHTHLYCKEGYKTA